MKKMKILFKYLAILTSLQLSGCSSMIGKISESGSAMVSAEPLDITVSELAAAMSNSNKRELLGRIVYDSEKKCTEFLNKVVSSQKTVNTSGDILTTILSGVATAVTPVNTIHAFTAASTIVSGTKSVLNTDLYARASVANFQLALQHTYFTAINNYLTSLQNSDESKIRISEETSKIQSIHALCGMAPVESSIAATITPPEKKSGSGSSSAAIPTPNNPPLEATTDQVPVKTQGAVPGSRIY